MTVREYIGARYVPLFVGQWDNTETYEPLSVVMYQGASYTSRQSVPAGVDIANTDYWALSGNYNAQVEAYRAEVAAYDSRITTLEGRFDENGKLEDDTVITDSISDDAVTADKIADSAVGTAAIADDAVTGAKIADGAIDTAQIADDAVTGAKIADGAIDTAQIVDGAVTDDKLANVDGFVRVHKIYYDTNNKCYVKCFKITRENVTFSLVAQAYFENNGHIAKWVEENEPAFAFNGPLGNLLLSEGNVIGNSDVYNYHWYVMAFDSDWEPTIIQDISNSYTATQLQAENYETAFRIWSPVLVNNVTFDWENTIPDGDEKDIIFKNKHTRTMFGWDDDFWYVVFIEGQLFFSDGANFNNMASVARTLGLTNCVNFDGGGSSQGWLSKPCENVVFQNKEKGQSNPQDSRDVSLIVVERSN